MDSGNNTAAIAAYESALASGLDTTDSRHAKLRRAHALFRLRRYDEARLAFAAQLPEPEARFWYARSLARSGRPQQAISEFEAIGASNDAKRATWALLLAGTLLEDRNETERATALYRQVAARDDSGRGLDATWRLGWSAYRRGEFTRARAFFAQMVEGAEPLGALRPRYWAARSAESVGDAEAATREFTRLAENFPLSYYGWRAGQRLGRHPGSRAARATVAPGTSRVNPREIERIELLIEAGLADFAQEELSALAGRARGLQDRKSLARLYIRTGDFHRGQRLVVDAYAELLSRGVQAGNEALWWLSWPPAYREIIRELFSEKSRIEPALVWAIMREESGYRPQVTSSAGARGLLQIMPETGTQLAQRHGYPNFDPDDLFTPQVNLALGTAYLDELRRHFPDRLSAAISSYNAGPSAVDRWLLGDAADRDDDAWVEDIPYEQTRSYVKRVLRSLHVYRTVYGEAALLQRAPAAASSGS
jgi:soluble lytic murein transglycosylase